MAAANLRVPCLHLVGNPRRQAQSLAVTSWHRAEGLKACLNLFFFAEGAETLEFGFVAFDGAKASPALKDCGWAACVAPGRRMSTPRRAQAARLVVQSEGERGLACQNWLMKFCSSATSARSRSLWFG